MLDKRQERSDKAFIQRQAELDHQPERSRQWLIEDLERTRKHLEDCEKEGDELRARHREALDRIEELEHQGRELRRKSAELLLENEQIRRAAQ